MKILSLVLFLVLFVGSATAQNVTIKGFITDIQDKTVIINAAGTKREVYLDKGTTVKESRKNVFRDPKIYQVADLCLALPVKVKGFVIKVDKVVAVTIYIDGQELAKAKILNERIKPVEIVQAKQEEELKNVSAATYKNSAQIDETNSVVDTTRKEVNKLAINFATLSDVVNGIALKIENNTLIEKYNASLYFPSASAKLRPEHHVALQQLAEQLLVEKDYVIEIRGFASTDGNVYANKYLSNERAENVKEALLQAYNVPLRSIISYGFGGVADENPEKARKVVLVVYGKQ